MKLPASFSFDQIIVSDFLNGMPIGIALLDTDLRILEMNHLLEALLGYTCADVRGVFADFIFRSNLGNNGKVFREVLESGDSVSVTGDIINLNLKKIPIQFTITPLKNLSSGYFGLMIALEDISILQSFDKQRQSYDGTGNILGHSPQMQEIFALIPVLAHTEASVLLTGETGTGKDMIAEAIHNSSKRSGYPFIKINCGALPESLLESELFGHVRGAFTGAVKDKPGMFYLADKGTIFLTEIGDLPLSLQVKLLSVLDDKEFFPVGGTKKIKVDVRVIAATHQPLRKLVAQGKFREDLFYRLNVLRVHLPALKEREGDIRLLMDHFLRKFNTNLNKRIKGFSARFIETLIVYNYPGNVRELRNIVEYAANICQVSRIKAEHLPQYIFAPQLQIPTVDHNNFVEKNSPAENKVSAPDKSSLSGTVGWTEFEKEMIMDAMKTTKGNRSQAAKMLGWGRTTLWRKLNLYGLN